MDGPLPGQGPVLVSVVVDVVLRKLGRKGGRVVAGRLIRPPRSGSVVVIEREKAPAMLALADKKVADEAARIEAIARGDTASKWLPAALRAAGVLKEGESL